MSSVNDSEECNNENYLEIELTRLRQLIEIKTNENTQLETKLNECEQQANLKIEQLNQDFSLKLEQTLQKFQEGQQEKQSSLIMKYAAVEKRCIELTRSKDSLESKLNDANRENKFLSEKCLKLKSDLNKSLFDYEKKCLELVQTKKETEKLKSDLLMNETREIAIKLKQEETNETENKELKSLKSQLIDLNEERNTLKDRLKCMDQERARQDLYIQEITLDLDNLQVSIKK
jgi:hypothetical protein